MLLHWMHASIQSEIHLIVICNCVVTWWSSANRFSMQKTFQAEIMCLGHLSSKQRENANSKNPKWFHSNTDNTMKMICHLHVHCAGAPYVCVWCVFILNHFRPTECIFSLLSSFTIRVSASTFSTYLALAFSYTHSLNHPFTHSLSMFLCFGIFFAEAMCV